MNPEMPTELSGRLTDPAALPEEGDFAALLGRSFDALNEPVQWLACARPAMRAEWRFSLYAGWHRVFVLDGRRLCYVLPRNGAFRFMVLLGDPAVATLRRGLAADVMAELMRHAKKQEDNTVFVLDSHRFDPDLAIALLEAKLAH